MTKDLDQNIYTYYELPWISKSVILSYRFCQFLFKLRHFSNVDTGTSAALETGTNLHAVYAKFFEILDYTQLQRIPIEYDKPVDKTKVYNMMWETITSMIPVDSREYEPYQIMVRNFALLEADHWISLNYQFKEVYSKVIKFFVPKIIEGFRVCKELEIYGTIDRGSIWEDDEKVTIIYDYKTGWVPIHIIEERDVKSGDPFSWTLKPKRNMELHFYIILDMSHRGYKIDPEIVEFCTNEKYFVEDAEFPKVKSYFYDKYGEPVDFTKLYRIGIIHTGYKERPFVPKRKAAKVSMKTAFKWINIIRTVIKQDGPFEKHPSYFLCRNCNKNIQDMCLGEEERKMFFWEGEKDSDKNKESND